MRRLALSLFLIGMGGCGGEDVESKLVGSLDEAIPAETFVGSGGESMLPASITSHELARRIKADGYDPRDASPSYQFTSAPGDVSRLPAEAEPVSALLVGWSSGASDLTSFFAEVVGAASSDTQIPKIVVYVPSSTQASQLLYALNAAGANTKNISFLKMSLDTIWMRDYGPLLVKTQSGGSRVIDLRYYYGRWNDDVAPTKLASSWKLPVSRPKLEAEGGNFQSDGAGSCITTTWMVEQNAGFGYKAQDVKNVLKSYLGCQNTIILPRLDGEGTGHVDMYVTITGPKQALVGQYATSDDLVNAKVTDQGASMLTAAGFKVTRIPMPTNRDGNYRSYTNSLAVGKTVLVPVYSDDTRYEKQALKIFQTAYPGRQVIPIDSTDIIRWAGAVHCVTMTLGS